MTVANRRRDGQAAALAVPTGKGVEVSNVRFERALAELIAGSDGGWSLWLGALAGLAAVVEESRVDGEMRFINHPAGEVRRLRQALAEAITRAELAAEIRIVVTEHGDASATSIALLLAERARETVADRA